MTAVDPLVSQTLGGTKDAELSVECVNCKITTFHRVLASVETVHSIADDLGRVLNDHQIIQCQGCRNISFRNRWAIGDIGDAQPMTEREDLFPPRIDKARRQRMDGFRNLPRKTLPIYFETLAAMNGQQPILAGVGIRALVESVCKHKRTAGRNLEQRIDDLVAKGLLSKKDALILHKVRFLGNKAAHEQKPPAREALEAAMTIAEHLLKTVYVLPVAGKTLRSGR